MRAPRPPDPTQLQQAQNFYIESILPEPTNLNLKDLKRQEWKRVYPQGYEVSNFSPCLSQQTDASNPVCIRIGAQLVYSSTRCIVLHPIYLAEVGDIPVSSAGPKADSGPEPLPQRVLTGTRAALEGTEGLWRNVRSVGACHAASDYVHSRMSGLPLFENERLAPFSRSLSRFAGSCSCGSLNSHRQ